MPDPANFFLDKEKLCIMLLPKTCSTAMKCSLMKAYGKKDARDLPIVPTNDIPENYFVITVVRNPYERFRSGYDNKIKQSFLQTLNRVHGMTKNMTPLEIAEICRDTPDDALNQHFQSQYSLCCPEGRWLPNMVLKQENIGTDWWQVQSIFRHHADRILPDLDRMNVSNNRTELDEATKAVIRERYALDFETFGYQP